jgi:hypothetical protein
MPYTRQHNPELIRNALFAKCKFFWGAGLVAKLFVFLFGVIVVIAPMDGKVFALIALGLAVVSEFLIWRSDRWKSAAHGLHRKLDFENSFGWFISESELMDYLARYPGNIEDLIGKSTGSYFASNEAPGPKRAVENLRESAWWSEHLAESMFWVSLTVINGAVVGCVLLLNASIASFSQPPIAISNATVIAENALQAKRGVSEQTIKIVTSAIIFLFTYGLIKFATGYFSFSAKGKQIRESCERLIQSSKIDEIQAVKLWQDYHLAREAAPILPTWIWKLREKKLNALWNCYVKNLTKTD